MKEFLEGDMQGVVLQAKKRFWSNKKNALAK